ncbi:MAG: DUF47 family protein [Candidatus Omnitrophica bacterium]|nr:DUF47 family protein [Candidatus Omnitrophota bacterium]
MKEIRNILGWLGMAEEQSIMQDAQKHVQETYQTVTYFADAIKAFTGGDLSVMRTAIENVRESEHRADQLRTKMVDELSKGLLVPPDREDLMHFVKSLDRIADWTNGAARLLEFIDQKLPQNILSNMSSATSLIVNSITKLKEGIQALAKNDLKKALSDCEIVDHIEHDADDQKRLLIETIVKADLKPAALLICYQLAEYLEGITDKIEDAADLVKVLAIKAK